MKSIIPFAAGLALALAPAAHAQVSCKQVNALLGYAVDDFEEIIDTEIEDDYYKSSYYLAGAAECTVDHFLDSVYVCTWTYASKESASSAYKAQLSALSSCLVGWTPDAATPDAKPVDGYQTLEGRYLMGSTDDADLEWGVIMEEHTFDSGKDWHVVVELAYLW